jgi:hypothetical protein
MEEGCAGIFFFNATILSHGSSTWCFDKRIYTKIDELVMSKSIKKVKIQDFTELFYQL